MQQSPKRLITVFLWALGMLFWAGPGAAQAPEDIVRWIYTSWAQPGLVESKGLNSLSNPARRDQYFTARMQGFFAANDTYQGDLSSACIDFALDIPGQDFDPDEIARTIQVTRRQAQDQMTLIAQFTQFGRAVAVHYDFVIEDGYWRIDDIAGPGWRVSQIPCQPRSTPHGFCYQSDLGRLKIEPSASGSALVSLDSWQGNGHHCGLQGQAAAIDSGWMFESTAGGQLCRLQILRTQDDGIWLSDPEWTCKAYFCGARAVLDGLSFAASSRVDCAAIVIDR